MNKPFKMKGFSGFGNSPAKQKPGGGVGEALDHWEKFRKGPKTQRASTFKNPRVSTAKIRTAPKLTKVLGRAIPGIGLASLLYKPTKKGTAKKVLQKSIRTIKDK